MIPSPAPLEAYPLTWPSFQPRTPSWKRVRGKFKSSLGASRDGLIAELGRLGAMDIIVSTDLPTRRDGLPYATASIPKDPGVAVYFNRWFSPPQGAMVKKAFVIACDTYLKVEANMRAVQATVEALRAIQRHGASTMLEQAFTGFAALPPGPNDAPEVPWWEVLGVKRDDKEHVIRAAYVELAKENHPDKGGSTERMQALNDAYKKARGAGGW